MTHEVCHAQEKTVFGQFKQQAVEPASQLGATKRQIAEELGIGAKLLGRWCKEFSEHGDKAFPGHGKARDEEVAALRLERAEGCQRAWRQCTQHIAFQSAGHRDKRRRACSALASRCRQVLAVGVPRSVEPPPVSQQSAIMPPIRIELSSLDDEASADSLSDLARDIQPSQCGRRRHAFAYLT